MSRVYVDVTEHPSGWFGHCELTDERLTAKTLRELNTKFEYLFTHVDGRGSEVVFRFKDAG